MKRFFIGCSLLVSSWAVAAPTALRPARDTAFVGRPGSYSVGVFNPLRIGVADRLELQANPLLFFVAPHLDARYALVANSSLYRLTVEAGLLVPTFGMRLMKGFFFPTWATSTDTIGWMVVPRLGLTASFHGFGNGNPRAMHVGPEEITTKPSGFGPRDDVWTVKLDMAFRVPFGPTNAGPLNSFVIPLDLLLAAPLTGFCSHAGVAYDHALSERLRLRGEANVYLTGSQGDLVTQGVNVGPLAQLSGLIFTAHLGLDVAVFQRSRVTVGVLWANMDQGALAISKGADGFSTAARVRSNNFLPTLDYIWEGW